MKKRKKRSMEDIIFDFVVYVVLIAISLICLLPVWHIVVAAFSNTADITTTEGLMLWPKKVYMGAFDMVFQDKSLILGFKNTLIYKLASGSFKVIKKVFDAI